MTKKMRKILAFLPLIILNIFIVTFLFAGEKKIDYPVKEVSKINCKNTEFKNLTNTCKTNLPILNTKDYSKYSKLNWGNNDYTKYYSVLWGSSYKYAWDVWFWGHQGTDIASSRGTPVYSIADGRIINSKTVLGWGKIITVEHFIEWKKVFSNYAHLSEMLVKKGKKVKKWDLIWKIWSSWNAYWNHLHFQIDLDTPYHPYYYSRTTCPYSYYEITEKWVCIDDLRENTLDPLLFIETQWKILNNLKKDVVKIEKVYTPAKDYNIKKDNIKVVKKNTKIDLSKDISAFNKTVYIWYSSKDIKEVQQVLRDLKLYNWRLTWNYNDIKNIVYDYQWKNKLVYSWSSPWAGWFWPKTRATMKKEYNLFLAGGWTSNYYVKADNKKEDKIIEKKIDVVVFKKEEVKKDIVVLSKDISVFNKTVYIWYPKRDIKEVQQVLRDLKLYNGSLTWNYNDIKNVIYNYQINKWIVYNWATRWAGRFWPTTRITVKKDYDNFLALWWQHNYYLVSVDEKNDLKDPVDNIEKVITNKKLLTKEEKDLEEYQKFVKRYKIDINLKNNLSNIFIGDNSSIDIKVIKKYNNKPFKGTLPFNITIDYDSTILNISPSKFYSFSTWERNIRMIWKKAWTTVVKIKFKDEVLKTYTITVYANNEKVYLNSTIFYWPTSVFRWRTQKSMAIFKDKNWRKLINIEYTWNYKLKWSFDTMICIKKGSMSNFSSIYAKPCKSEDFKKEINFTYKDTIGWILLFDYKIIWKSWKIQIINTYNNSILLNKTLKVK